MIAFRVKKNGELLCTAGAEDLGVLTTIVRASGLLGPKTHPCRSDESFEFGLRVGGLTTRESGDDEHMVWTSDVRLDFGDKIEIEIIESDIVDTTTDRTPAKKR